MQQFHGPKYCEQPHAAKFHADIKVAMCAAVEEDSEDEKDTVRQFSLMYSLSATSHISHAQDPPGQAGGTSCGGSICLPCCGSAA